MNKFWLNFLYVLLIIGVLAFCGWMVFWITGESGQCMRDPIGYFYNHTENIVCHCGEVTDISKEIQLNLSEIEIFK